LFFVSVLSDAVPTGETGVRLKKEMTKKEEKQRRMELRKKLGSRIIKPPKHPPFNRGSENFIAHECFKCRKSFKLKEREDESAKCPQCDGKLYSMGRSFKPPKKDDEEQWIKVQLLYS
jgi:DNA-directed RNA polymerase subunit RPC12/RpoP